MSILAHLSRWSRCWSTWRAERAGAETFAAQLMPLTLRAADVPDLGGHAGTNSSRSTMPLVTRLHLVDEQAESVHRDARSGSWACRSPKWPMHLASRNPRGTQNSHEPSPYLYEGASGLPVSDVEAQARWLDRLLAADEAQRQASLEALATANPELHQRA